MSPAPLGKFPFGTFLGSSGVSASFGTVNRAYLSKLITLFAAAAAIPHFCKSFV